MTIQQCSRAQQKSGALIEWHGLEFTVLDRATGSQKRILTDIYGMAQPGRLLSIMGPSGAGKSTLLDVLACTASSRGASLEGRVLVDGRPRSVRDLRRISCYVQQKDVLLSSATVREVVLTSALLKLPRSVPVRAKRELVEATLRDLDLTSCANTLIGDETIGLKGISGGQKRRVSVGIELVKDPRVLFLDEPTSGLDSEMALSVMTCLVRLARRGRTVVCTIHQPNSDITDCFDDFLLLAAGRVVYGGLWSGAVDFFARNGYSCPAFKNPTDYFMSVVTRQEEAVDTLATAYDKARATLLQQQQQHQHQAAAQAEQAADPDRAPAGAAAGPPLARAPSAEGEGWDVEAAPGGLQPQQPAALGVPGGGAGGGSASAGEGGQTAAAAAAVAGHCALSVASPPVVALEAGEDGSSAGLQGGAEADAAEARVPMWFQVAVLSQRYWRTWIRNPIMMTSELVQYVFTAVFVGLMYLRLNLVPGEGDYNRASCIWFSFAVLCFTPSYTAVTNWASERLLLKRELDQRQYGITAYYLARYSVVIPFQLAQCALFLSVMYFFAGFQASPGGFFTFFAVFSMFQVVSEGIGSVCAVATRTATASVILLTFVLLLVLAFSGFLTVKVPVYFVWVQKTSYLTYAYAALLEREFSHITFTDPATGQQVPGMQLYPPSADTGLTFSQNVGVLAGQLGGMELIKLATLHLAYRLNLM